MSNNKEYKERIKYVFLIVWFFTVLTTYLLQDRRNIKEVLSQYDLPIDIITNYTGIATMLWIIASAHLIVIILVPLTYYSVYGHLWEKDGGITISEEGVMKFVIPLKLKPLTIRNHHIKIVRYVQKGEALYVYFELKPVWLSNKGGEIYEIILSNKDKERLFKELQKQNIPYKKTYVRTFKNITNCYEGFMMQ